MINLTVNNLVKHTSQASIRFFVFFLIFGIVGSAQPPQQPGRMPPPGDFQHSFHGLHHPVSTKNVEAQRLFDQGLGLIYALDYIGAANAFQRAAALDPNMAMAYWGIAYALGFRLLLSHARRPGA